MESSTLIKLLSDRRQLAGVGITFIEGSDQERFLSYDQLYHSALKVLSVLQRKGMQDGDELVIQIQDNRTFIIAFWACLLGGIVPVPLSVGQNDNHREKVYTIWPVLKNPHLITAEDNFTRLGAFARSNGFERTFSGIADKTVKEPEIWLSSSEGKVFDAKPDDIAFVQFSSGSTGNPRGVMLTHRNLLTNIGAIERAARYTKSDSTISWMPLTHDMGLIGFHLNPLFSKINQFLIPTANFIRRPALWLDKVNEHRVTILCSPNFGYKYLLKHIQPDTGKNWDLSCVRVLYNGAEPISGKLCREFLARMAVHGLPGNAMCPVYGLAEASLAVTVSGLDDEVMSINADRNKLNAGDRITSVWEEDKNAVAIVNVGRVVADCILRIADDDDKPVEKDVIGHIQIKGENVTAGYYNNKAETRKIITGDGWLRTGDLGFIKEGSLYITGRAKDIFFVNGQNFYPHDIEQLAQEVEGIELNKIVVAGLPADDLQTEEVIAFILHRGSLADLLPLMASLKEHINSKAGIELDRIIPVKDIPRTTSGKLQRYKLIEQLRKGDFADIGKKVQALTEAAGQIAPAPSAAAAGNEQILLQIWQRVLGTGNIGVTQRFFEIGGNSLKAAEVAMILSKEFQTELPMELLYEKQTIRELASEIGFPGKGGYSPIPEGPRNECHPLSWAQKRIYYFAELNKTSIAYNVPVALRIRGHVNVGRLENNINELIARHDVLRMSFPIAGEPVFRVNEDIKVRVDRIACDEDRIDEELRAQVRPFNLAIAPLFSVRLLELKGKEEYILFLDFHHIIADGMSVYQFIDELFGSYSGNRLPALSVDYKDYVYWEKDSEQSKEIGRQQAFWLGELQGDLQLLDMPADFSRGAILSTEGAKLAFQINGETVTRLKQVAAANTCTLHVLLFSLYAVLLSKLTGQREVIIGVPVAGRRHPDLQKMIGMFVNNLAVKSSIDGDETLVQLLARQKEKMLAAFANQEYPFEQLIQDLGPTPDSSRNPVFDSMFIYQNMGFPDISTANLGVSPYFFDPGISKFDISMEVFERGESISYYIEYPTKLFKRETILRFAEYFDNLIGHAAGNSREKLADWSLMNERTYFRCVTAFNAT
ncbi:MAG TPA: condensation domain-containing protein, partial [Puia sp.]|nr:condensation domain-containing protein [Puia sp.]